MPNLICEIDINSQTMKVSAKCGFEKTYSISTAQNGVNAVQGSGGTPLGSHYVSEKIGAFHPLYAVFKAREYQGYEYSPINTPPNEDGILTRILRLRGCEPGINKGVDSSGNVVDSHSRYIYIHGTNREDLLGTPASHGCIRMANEDIAELFLKIQQGSVVKIKCTPT